MTRLLRAPLAITAEGDILLNLTELDVPGDVEAIAKAILKQKGYVFIGVLISRTERRRLTRDLALVLPNVTMPLVAHRLRLRGS